MAVVKTIDGQRVEFQTEPTAADIEEYRRLSQGQRSPARVGIQGVTDFLQYQYQQAAEGLKDIVRSAFTVGPSAQEIAAYKAKGLSDAQIANLYKTGEEQFQGLMPPGVEQRVVPRRDEYLTRYLGAGTRGVAGTLGIGGPGMMFAAGTTGEIGGDIAQALGGPRVAGEFIGALSPLATGVIGGKKAFVQAAESSPQITQRLSDLQIKQGVNAIAEEVPDLGQRLQTVEQLRTINPNFKPTLTQVTGSAAAESMMKQQFARSPSFAGTITKQQKETDEAINKILVKTLPIGTAFEEATKTELARSLRPVLENKANYENTLINLGLAIKNQTGNEQVLGQQLRKAFEENLKSATSVKNNLYSFSTKYASDKGLTVPNTDAQRIYNTILDSGQDPAQLLNSLSPKEQRILQKLYPEGPSTEASSFGAVDANDIDGMIKSLNQRIFRLKGAADPESLTEALRLSEVRNTMMQSLKSIPDQKYQGLLSTADDFYRTEFKPTFRQGMGYRMSKYGQEGFDIANSEVVREFLKKPENLDDFIKIYGNVHGDRKDAFDLFEQGVFTVLFRDSKQIPSSEDVTRFLSRYDDGLKKFPSIRDKLLNTQSLLQEVEKQGQVIAKTQDDTLASVLGKNKDRYVSVDEQGIISLNSPELSDTIRKSFVGAAGERRSAVDRNEFLALRKIALSDKDATESFRNNVMRIVAEQPNPLDYLKANRDLILPLYRGNAKDLKFAEDVLRGVEMAALTPMRGIPVTTAVPELGAGTGIGLSQIISKLTNPILSGSTATAQVFSKVLAKQIELSKDKATREILANPMNFKQSLEKAAIIKDDPKTIAKELVGSIDFSPVSNFFAKAGLRSGIVAIQPNGNVVVNVNGQNYEMPVEEVTRENIEFIRQQQGQ
jgi:hypothetical protein